MKKNLDSIGLLKSSEFSTKVYIYMSSKTAGDDFDAYEANYTFTNLNPIIIKAYVREISSEALVYKQYGLHQMGAKEIVCEARFKNMFLNCNKLTISGIEYQVFKEGTGNRAVIQERPNNLIKIVVMRNG